MASTKDFVEYVCEQLNCVGEISYKKMFGEYALYLDNKVIALVCDNQLFVKMTKAADELLVNPEIAAPYKGAKPYLLISDFENQILMKDLILKTWEELPFPKPKKKKDPKNVV